MKQKENIIGIDEISNIKDLLDEKIYILIGLFKKLFKSTHSCVWNG